MTTNLTAEDSVKRIRVSKIEFEGRAPYLPDSRHFGNCAGRTYPTHLLSPYRFDANPIVYRLAKSLFAAQVALRRLHRYMPKQELYLFQLTADCMAESGARSSKVVRREFRHLQFLGVHLNYVPDHFLSHPIPPNCPCPADATKQFARGDLCCCKPFVEELLHPSGNGNGSNVSTFPDEVDDCPTLFPSLKVIETEIGQFTSSKTATEQDGNDPGIDAHRFSQRICKPV